MNDIALSLVIAALTCAAILLMFIMIGRRAKAKEEEMESYCLKHGYALDRRNESLRKEFTVEAEGFTLKSKMVSHRQAETTGSSSWEKETIWETNRNDGPWPDFILGSVPASLDWHSIPDLIKNSATEKLNSQTGGNYSPGQGRVVYKNKTAAFLLFEKVSGGAKSAIYKLIPLLEAWPEKDPLVIRSGAQGVSVHIKGLFIQDSALMDQIIRLGQACSGWDTRDTLST